MSTREVLSCRYINFNVTKFQESFLKRKEIFVSSKTDEQDQKIDLILVTMHVNKISQNAFTESFIVKKLCSYFCIIYLCLLFNRQQLDN